MQYAQLVSLSTQWVLDNLLNLATALIVLVVGWMLAGLVSRYVGDLLHKTRRFDKTIAPLFAHLVRYGIIAITLVVVLSQFGVQTASILAVMGAIGLAVALALQGTLSNIAAGVMLIWLRPFNVGEYIDGEGIAGTVVEIGLFGTRLRTYDGIYTFAPNSRLWDAKIVNYSREPRRMIETKVGIAYDADLKTARQTLLSIASGDKRVLAEPQPFVFVASLGDSAVNLTMRCWVAGSDWWQTNVDFIEQALLALDAAGVEITYNKLDVYVRQPDDRRGAAPAAGPGGGPQPGGA
jgi:small conductance mechanosensitive channel